MRYRVIQYLLIQVILGCAVIRGCAAGALGVAGIASVLGRGAGVAPVAFGRVGTVDERFQSFNIEMLEVTGGRFWAPYKAQKSAAEPQDTKTPTPAGMDPSLYRYRAPIDLANARLRKLAAALGPTYVRVS